MPVLPAVPSTMTPPGLSSPFSSASRMMNSPARSLTDWPGFMNSALPRISQPVSSEARFRRISGVLPIASITELSIKFPLVACGATLETHRAAFKGGICAR